MPLHTTEVLRRFVASSIALEELQRKYVYLLLNLAEFEGRPTPSGFAHLEEVRMDCRRVIERGGNAYAWLSNRFNELINKLNTNSEFLSFWASKHPDPPPKEARIDPEQQKNQGKDKLDDLEWELL